jgi:hypothetical protein
MAGAVPEGSVCISGVKFSINDTDSTKLQATRLNAEADPAIGRGRVATLTLAEIDPSLPIVTKAVGVPLGVSSPYDPAKEEKDSPKEELHGGAWRARRCVGEGGLPTVTDVVGEVVEVHNVVEELLSTTTGLERVRRRLVTEELLAAVQADGDGR